MEPYTPSEEEKALALRAAKAVGADFAGVDLLFTPQEPLVCEVNSNAHFKNLFSCTGVNTARENTKAGFSTQIPRSSNRLDNNGRIVRIKQMSGLRRASQVLPDGQKIV